MSDKSSKFFELKSVHILDELWDFGVHKPRAFPNCFPIPTAPGSMASMSSSSFTRAVASTSTTSGSARRATLAAPREAEPRPGHRGVAVGLFGNDEMEMEMEGYW